MLIQASFFEAIFTDKGLTFEWHKPMQKRHLTGAGRYYVPTVRRIEEQDGE